MNLIEQLGGYEKALNLFKGCPWDDGIVDVPDPRSEGMLRLDLGELSIELLAYRRANNIFEVGDKVIKTHPKNTILWPVLGVYKDGGVWLDYKGFNWKPPRVRHATDEEIAAGHRL